MLEFWAELPWWLRLIVAYGLIILGGLIVFSSIRSAQETDTLVRHFAGRRLIAGIVIAGVGAAMTLIGERSDAEKKGYRV